MTDLHIEVNLDTPSGVLTLTSGAASGTDPWLLDGMSWRWTRGDQSSAGQPEPMECRFVIVAPGPLQLDIGARVSAQLWDAPPPGDSGEVVGFYGRVAEVVASPTEYADPGDPELVVKAREYDITCVDYTVDLAEVTANIPAMVDGVTVAAGALNRIRGYVAAAEVDGAPQGVYPGPLGIDSWVNLKNEDAGAGGLLERISGVLDQVGTGELPGDLPGETAATALDRRKHRRAILSPRIDATTLPGVYAVRDVDLLPASWAVDPPPATYDSATPADFPLVLTAGPDGYGLVPDDTSPLCLSGDLVDYAARWRRDKFTHPNRATVTYTPEGADDESAVTVNADDKATTDPVANLPLSAPLLGRTSSGPTSDPTYGPRRMALMYLPEADARDRWTAEAFRYYPPDWTRLQYAPWFPRHADIDGTPQTNPPDPATRAQCYGHPLVISGIDPDHDPTGRGWYAGTLHGVTLTCDGTDPVLEVTLRRVVPVPTGAGALTPADLDPGITVADLDPLFTVYDYRLARGA